MSQDFESTGFPPAYLITFRCYGTWLHGDTRGSMDRRGHNIYGTPGIPTNRKLESSEVERMKRSPLTLYEAQRAAVEEAVKEVCEYRGFILRAINVRTNHVHVVVSAACKPETVMNAFKAYSTRKLRELGLLPETGNPWARHGSTLYLWKPRHVEMAVEYVLYGQGDSLPSFSGEV
jgi:REP element-mobilizing transposase RayT